ncbi:uncharacterized protein N7459_001357 [Penicillium hispanicum]|uniref:uncharacterized protein n=1 Tax=Penicillium hispanicum TaxID=1080232 RepID=UPI002542491F|nr:uncharacterized protein N7459_001357 [Penicillium hispanicum]KAJ5595149.1 hypothetical protein N7459_001357 [Penicillium hispanicum]
MPGVPTGRACEGCRKQKKKCDEKQPACGRCVRLSLKCIGSGQQRFKFQAEKRYANLQRGDRTLSFPDVPNACSSPHSSPEASGMRVWVPPPSSEHSLLATAFTSTIKRSTDFRYNLWWTFGAFLEDVPRRLGTNEALDRAVDAVTTAHASFCGGRGVTIEMLTKYSRALSTLRVYLDDPVHAQSSSTLGAVMLLLACQTFLGQNTGGWTGHAEGAALILRARKNFGPRDDFEKKLFLSLRGVVLFEGLFNERINLSPDEWQHLVSNEFDENSPDGQMLKRLAQAPNLMRRARHALQTGQDTTAIQEEVMAIHQACKLNLDAMRNRSVENNIAMLNLSNTNRRAREFLRTLFSAHYERTYGIGLTVVFFFNCMLSGLGAHDETTILDANAFSEEALALAERSAMYRPMGAGYMIFCLQAAWTATADRGLRDRLIAALVDFQDDFKVLDRKNLVQTLEWTAEYLRLGQSPSLRMGI